MADSRYPPEEYFDGHDLSIARAIYANDRSSLKIFVQEPGFDVNKIGKQGISFLLYAIYAEQKKMVEFLLAHGADPNLLNPEVKENLGGKRFPPTISEELPLSYVSRSFFAFDLDYVRMLVKYGADINDNRVSPPLIVCMTSGEESRTLKLISYLLDHGADINIRDRYYNDSPIIAAARISLWDVVNYFLDRGANYEFINNAGTSVAYYVQDEIAMNKGTAKRKEKVHALKRRLEKLGVEFPVEKGESTFKKAE